MYCCRSSLTTLASSLLLPPTEIEPSRSTRLCERELAASDAFNVEEMLVDNGDEVEITGW